MRSERPDRLEIQKQVDALPVHAARRRVRPRAPMLLATVAVCCLAGCRHNVQEASPQRVLEFQNPVPEGPAVDYDELTQARFKAPPYRVAPGEVLDIQIPRVLTLVSSEAATSIEGRVGYTSRVSDDGSIVLPVVGRLDVAGKSLAGVESDIVSAYYPRYTKIQPAIYVSVAEYRTCRVSIVGAVARPGIYLLKPDQMSLVALLMEAGGISERGAAVIRIRRAAQGGSRIPAAPAGISRPLVQRQGNAASPTGTWTPAVQGPAANAGETTLVLPVRGLNIPFEDVALQEGDSVFVEWPREQFVCVMGLVTRTGCFPYPVTAEYNLVQAIALAGGLDLIADPRYVTVYRLNANGEVSSVTVQLVSPRKQERLTESLSLPLKPGDIVSVEHTPRTRMNLFFDRIFRVTLGLYFSPDDLWNNNG